MSSDKLPEMDPTTGTGDADSAPKKQIVSLACRSCQAAKRKCNGKQPCQPCMSKHLECIFERDKDGRRSRKRKLEKLYTRAEALEKLLEVLRGSQDESAHDLLKVIRDKDLSIEEIVREADAIVQRDGAPSKSRAHVRDYIMSVASLVDEPPIRVPASPWTRVTDDDDAVSHLISGFFAWHHFAYPSVDKRIFVEAMRAKDLSTPFCSPFLVNSMLMMACMYTDHPAAFAHSDDPSTRSLHFQEEAIRLWNLEEGRVSLTNLQGLPSLLACVDVSGKDRLGFLYTSHCIHLGMELVKAVKKGVKQGLEDFTSEDFQRSYKLALWAAFNVQTEAAVAWMKHLDLRVPSVLPPYGDEEMLTTEVWRPYPKHGHEAVFYPAAIDSQRFKLYEIASGLLPLVLSGNAEDSPLPGYIILDRVTQLERLQEMELKLREWHRQLPSQVTIEKMDPLAPNAPLVDLHLAYHSFYITAQSLARRRLAEAELDQSSTQEKIIEACQKVAGLLDMLRQTITFSYFPVYHMHACSVCAYNLLDFLSHPRARNAFSIAIIGLLAASRRWTIALGVVKMIWIIVQERKLEPFVPESTLSLLKLGAVDKWGPEDHRRFEMCSYPNYAAAAEKGRQHMEMGELLAEYSRLSLGSEGKPS